VRLDNRWDQPTHEVLNSRVVSPSLPHSTPSVDDASAAVRVMHLTKSYVSHKALDNVSFALQAKTMTVLLGPNGAGKSTLFQVLTGLFAADAGDVHVAGHSMARATTQALARMGVVFQQMALDLDLSVDRNLRFHADLHGMPRALASQRMHTLCQALGLAEERGRAVRQLSGGTRRKVELVRALMHEPAVILMDEPTVGLDPKSRRDLLSAVKADVQLRGSAVLWATHLVEEALAADRVLVLHRGRVLADGSPAAVTAQLGGATLEEAFINATQPAIPKKTEPPIREPIS
jgi:ABC-2 type transport system ATP-binding protein